MSTLKRYLSILLCFSFMASFAQNDEAGIRAAVNDFLDGGTNGNVSQFTGAFVNDAVQRSIGRNGNVIGMSVESLASKLKPGQTMDRQTEIVSITYSGIAGVAVTETIYPSSKIIDYLNLLKIGNEWKIVTRVYSRIEKDENVLSSSSQMNSNPAPSNSPAPAPKKKKPEVVIDDGW
ncbi:nuclear transport factor 2 family protein [Jiulongibacter sp. NS-SX5]|uniref:nuclear transport factor 2 family protein n=1 Tax=Jiulongibacter sp. NS-SX5 TaxID=3463854 RepID=UPI0040585BB5